MNSLKTLAIAHFLSLGISTYASAAMRVLPTDVIVCSYHDVRGLADQSTLNDCVDSTLWEIDPQSRQIWVFANVEITKEHLNQTDPLGLFISAKASSEAYLNGKLLGSNGEPGTNKRTEVPGIMDSVMYIPAEQLRLGQNDIALRMSSHHGILSLSSPIHYIGIGHYVNPTTQTLGYYWKALLPFGTLIIGAFYMGMLAWIKRNHWSVALLPLMSLVGAVQLYTEVYRGLAPYSYPVQDLRLIVILICSLMFGLCLAAHVIWSLGSKHKTKLFLALSLVTFVAIILARGFDTMSALALSVPASISLVFAVFSMLKKVPHARAFVAALGLFLACLILSPDAFLNVTFFYLIATLLVILFVNEIRAYTQERKQRLEEKARADKLQTVLEQNQKRDTSESINVGSAGTFEIIKIADIIYCKGAGDYAELVMSDGRSLLHSDRLTDLEKSLPSLFLRVHRSYIVNTARINSLTRKSSGVGELTLSDTHTVPVSRRIMPSVREKLA